MRFGIAEDWSAPYRRYDKDFRNQPPE